MVKVAIVKCPDYNRADVSQAVNRAITLLGPLDNFLDPQKDVLVKPNLLSARPPESGVVTHPEVVRAVVECTAKGFKKNILIGDSPGGCIDSVDEVYTACGIDDIVKSGKAKAIKFDKIRWVKDYPMAQAALDCNIISVPKFKTHTITTITCAIKNVFGVVAGMYKLQCHKHAISPEKFGSLLADVYSVATPKLSIVDGIVAMEGDGPVNGRLRNMGLIFASTDAVALDSVIAHIIGLRPLDIPMIRFCNERGLGCARLEDIEVVGENLEDSRIDDFKLPSTNVILKIFERLPNPILSQIGKFINFRPWIDKARCLGCCLCVKSCPSGAMDFKKGRVVINYKKCISCFCCREFCPSDAIEIRPTRLVRALEKLKNIIKCK